jgi:hypothetical protein
MALKGVTKDSNNCTTFLRLRNIFARRNTQKVKSTAVLDLELVPVHKLSSSSSSSSSQTVASLPYADNATVHQFTTWGPDFIGQEAGYSTGTFHIRGPVLVQNSPYSIQISIVGKDNSISNPISDTFVLLQRVIN